MSDFQGADVDALIDQGRALETAGDRLHELSETLTSVVGAVPWVGPDADAFRERFTGTVTPQLRDDSVRLGEGARALYLHAAEQDQASSPDGSVDDARYAELLGGQSWSDVINAAQDVWRASPFDDPLTIDDLGGRYIDSEEGKDFDPASVDLSADAIRDQIMRQGALGDCWYLAALMATAQSNPEFLARNIHLRDDGTWDVTLYEDGKPVTVNVRPDQLARDGARVDDDGSANSWHDDPIGWMSIYEQAAINHLGPDYESVIADTPARGLELVTGAPAQDSGYANLHGTPSLDTIQQALSENRPVTVMTDPLMPFNQELGSAHVYQVTRVEGNDIILINPWGDGGSKPHEVRVPKDVFFDNNITMTGIGGKPDEFGPPAP